jgi:hypothetical protein
MLPGFFSDVGGMGDAVEEWRRFVSSQRDEASDALASLDWISDRGPSAIRTEDRDRLGIPGLYIRHAAGWGVFYVVSDSGRPWSVTVLMVVNFAEKPIDPALAEVKRRMAAVK